MGEIMFYTCKFKYGSLKYIPASIGTKGCRYSGGLGTSIETPILRNGLRLLSLTPLQSLTISI